MPLDPVDALTAAIEAATVSTLDVFADDAVLDATVPDWRFTVRGANEVRRELAGWFREPGQLEEVRRLPLPAGSLVELTRTWEEHGVPHAAHQVHILSVADGRITADTAFCGGAWPASLLARIAEAERARG